MGLLFEQAEIKHIIKNGTHKERLKVLSHLVEFESLGYDDEAIIKELLEAVTDVDTYAYTKMHLVKSTILFGVAQLIGLAHEIVSRCNGIEGYLLELLINAQNGENEAAAAIEYNVKNNLDVLQIRINAFTSQRKAIIDFAKKHGYDNKLLFLYFSDSEKYIKERISKIVETTNPKIVEFFKNNCLYTAPKYSRVKIVKLEYDLFYKKLENFILLKLGFNDGE